MSSLEEIFTKPEMRATVNKRNLDSLKDYIVDTAYTRSTTEPPEDIYAGIRQVLKELSEANWDDAIQHVYAERLKVVQEREIARNALYPCGRCGTKYPRHTLSDLLNLPGAHHAYCPSCADITKKAYQRTCSFCEKVYMARTAVIVYDLCSDCYTVPLAQECRRVKFHLNRVQILDLPATLTAKQWVATLEHFSWKCAYCDGDFAELEHFLPIELGGGTAAANCLPSCKHCNSVKARRHPNTIDGLFPTENLTRIREWLAAQVAV